MFLHYPLTAATGILTVAAASTNDVIIALCASFNGLVLLGTTLLQRQTKRELSKNQGMTKRVARDAGVPIRQEDDPATDAHHERTDGEK